MDRAAVRTAAGVGGCWCRCRRGRGGRCGSRRWRRRGSRRGSRRGRRRRRGGQLVVAPIAVTLGRRVAGRLGNRPAQHGYVLVLEVGPFLDVGQEVARDSSAEGDVGVAGEAAGGPARQLPKPAAYHGSQTRMPRIVVRLTNVIERVECCLVANGEDRVSATGDDDADWLAGGADATHDAPVHARPDSSSGSR